MADQKKVAIVQARMGSSRLPGKTMMEIQGQPMLWHVVNRMRSSRLVDKIVIACSVSPADDPIEDFCKINKLACYRGDEQDVLDRYYQAAIKNQADMIIRITADCPLIDPEVADKVISVFLTNQGSADGASNVIKRTYPRGLDVEVFSFSALERCYKDAREAAFREHVTLFMYKNPSAYNFVSVEADTDLTEFRLTVDEMKDFELVRQIYKNLWQERKLFLLSDIIRLLESKPSLKGLNRQVQQKPVG